MIGGASAKGPDEIMLTVLHKPPKGIWDSRLMGRLEISFLCLAGA